MVDFRLLNGGPKCTIIETFNSRALIISPGKRDEFSTLAEAKKYIVEKGLEVNIEMIFGSSIKREIQKGKRETF